MSHGSYDLNLVSKRLILAGDFRSIRWPNIGDSHGIMIQFSLDSSNSMLHKTEGVFGL
jgi:hypothetical protein